MKKITVGIPQALLFYYEKDLWIHFFKKLNISVLLSDKTNKQIIDQGEEKSIDEACLSLKIYLGHIKNLQSRCDYILVPRLYSLKKGCQVCTNFNALYDIVHNLYPDASLLYYNIDVEKGKNEAKAFIHLGGQLGFSYIESYQAYLYAKEMQKQIKEENLKKQQKKLTSSKLKVLLAGHPYNLYDDYISQEIIHFLEAEDMEVIYSDILEEAALEKFKVISEDIHWTHNQQIMAAITTYQKQVDGIILISSFPCGPDSLAIEMIKRKIKTPTLHLVFENASSFTGMMTRLESFFDILKSQKEAEHERSH